jgi:hypothetical protein
VTPGVGVGVAIGVAVGVGAGVAVGVAATVGVGVDGRTVGVAVDPQAARPTAAIAVPMTVVSFMAVEPCGYARAPTGESEEIFTGLVKVGESNQAPAWYGPSPTTRRPSESHTTGE